ncbi:MAG TPA: HAMP domain-containing sensor histidine kinase [Bacteroidales bacterium]|nr:HAMP domain-containing sensor histidine kinase [Bacteroidales bacterium]
MIRLSDTARRTKIIFGLVAVILVLLSKAAEIVYFGNFEYRQRTKRFNELLSRKETVTENCMQGLKSFLEKGEDLDNVSNSRVFRVMDQEGITLLWYFDRKLVHWSDNSFNIPAVYDDSLLSKPIAFIHNGWFLVKSLGAGNEKMVLLYRISHEYGFENDIVRNGFDQSFRMPEGTTLSFDRKTSPFTVTDSKGKYLFSLVFPKIRQPSLYLVLPVLLWVLALLASLVAIGMVIKSLAGAGRRYLACITALAAYTVIYLILLFLKEPAVFFETGLFSSYHFTLNGFIPSLGHLLILSTLLAMLSWIFLRYISFKINETKNKAVRVFVLAACFALISFILVICHNTFTTLVSNSNINFEPFRVLDLSVYSIAGYISVFLLFLVPLMLLQKVLAESLHLGRKILLPAFVLSLPVFAIAGFPTDGGIWPLIVFYIVLAMTMMFGYRGNIGKFNMTVIFSLYFGLYSLFYLITLSEKKNTENKKVMAVSYSSDHDPEAENMLLDIWPSFSKDTVIRNVLSHDPVSQGDIENISRYLHEKYFNGYWGNFNMSVVTCSNDSPLMLNSSETLIDNCFEFFRDRLKKFGHQITGTDFWFLENQGGRSFYMGQLFYDLPGGRRNGLFIDLYSDVDAFQAGYSELLLDKKYHGYVRLKDYSFAKYINGNLVLQTGPFPYDKTDAQYVDKEYDYRLFEREGYNHVLYKNGNITVMISEDKLSVFDMIISFAYLFALTLLLTNLVLVIFLRPDFKKLLYLNLRQKLQLSFIAILLFAFITVGIVIALFSINQYRAQHLDNIKEKVSSVYSELGNKLSMEQSISAEWRGPAYASLNELLISLSNIFNSDINLYSKEGYLMATSRPEIFYRDLTSRRMNMEALNSLEYLTKSEYIHNETVASLRYISAYVPFYNSSGKLLAYLNLPYFRMQSIIAREISNVIVAVVNFTLLMIVVSMILVVVIAGRLTSPLRMLSEGLASVKLGRRSEHLEYSGHDEITDLVNQYNRMVDELQESAEKLANSEREFAWREMAKQVAHEIKNPLTPMKLNIQQLYKSWKDGIPGFDKKLERFTRSQIENIDTLSSIASAFSSFAKMPPANPVDVDIVEQVRIVMELFKNTGDITFRASWPTDVTIKVKADKEHLMGIFSNLIKNAIQSIPQGKEGIVRINTTLEGDRVLVSVSDNGAGIPKELKNNLFTPNFTTKSSGMGLGLSIVKRYVESAGGRIWFESEHLKGSVFFVELPVSFTVERH